MVGHARVSVNNLASTGLPSETWQQIFGDVIETSTEIHVRRTLALVCRDWKDLLYSCKSLWSTVDLTYPKRARFHLDRAQGSPLHMHWTRIRMVPTRLERLIAFPRDLLQTHASTVRNLFLYDARTNLLPHLDGLAFPMLRSFLCMSIAPPPLASAQIARKTLTSLSMPHLVECKLS